jgi:hypothetical protein
MFLREMHMEILGMITGLSASFIALYFVGKVSLSAINQINAIAVPTSIKIAEKLSRSAPKAIKITN